MDSSPGIVEGNGNGNGNSNGNGNGNTNSNTNSNSNTANNLNATTGSSSCGLSNNNGDSEGSSSGSEGVNPKAASPYSYTAPQWLLQEKQTPKFFSVPLSPVPNKTLKVAQSHISKYTRSRKAQKKANKLTHQLRQLQQEQQVHRQKVELLKGRLEAAQAAKANGLQEIRRLREDEIAGAISELESSLRQQNEQKFRDLEAKLNNEAEEKFSKQFEEAQKRLNEKQLEQDEREDPEPTLQEPQPHDLRSTALQKNIKQLQAKTERLSDMKKEIFWLLKQVIKAETKRKMENMKQKSNSCER